MLISIYFDRACDDFGPNHLTAKNTKIAEIRIRRNPCALCTAISEFVVLLRANSRGRQRPAGPAVTRRAIGGTFVRDNPENLPTQSIGQENSGQEDSGGRRSRIFPPQNFAAALRLRLRLGSAWQALRTPEPHAAAWGGWKMSACRGLKIFLPMAWWLLPILSQGILTAETAPNAEVGGSSLRFCRVSAVPKGSPTIRLASRRLVAAAPPWVLCG